MVLNMWVHAAVKVTREVCSKFYHMASKNVDLLGRPQPWVMSTWLDMELQMSCLHYSTYVGGRHFVKLAWLRVKKTKTITTATTTHVFIYIYILVLLFMCAVLRRCHLQMSTRGGCLKREIQPWCTWARRLAWAQRLRMWAHTYKGI